MRKSVVRLGLLVAFVASPLLAQTGNLLGNPRFDGSTSGWFVPLGFEGSLSYDTNDTFDSCSVLSGALQLYTNATQSGHGAAAYATCINTPPVGVSYRVGTSAEFFQTTYPAHVLAVVLALDAPSCGGNILGAANSGLISDSVTGWQAAWGNSLTIPNGTQSLQVYVQLTRDSDNATPIAADIDNVVLVPSGFIFGDDLEIDDLCRWSFHAG